MDESDVGPRLRRSIENLTEEVNLEGLSPSVPTTSSQAQMDEPDLGPRLRRSIENLIEEVNLEDPYYVKLQHELESDAKNLEAESWNLVVDQGYLKTLDKKASKRQEVIYELIQTEMHHVRTLKILLYVYMYEMRKNQVINEKNRLDWLFSGADVLLVLHEHFLKYLKQRQYKSQEAESPKGYQISQLGDIILSQFSGSLGENMVEGYSIFSNRHSEAVSYYKDELQKNKKLQTLTTKLGQLTVVRRLEIPECFLLVIQRITKYPLLLERIIKNTEADTSEYKSLEEALMCIKDIISQVNAQVQLKEISSRLDPKSVVKMENSQLFRRENLIQANRQFLYKGTVTWKSSAQQKDVQAVLLSDVILFLEEKDQKFVFAALDDTPSVISLEKLIVREVAHEERAIYLICAFNTISPKMYEIHTESTEECQKWSTFIRDAVDCHREAMEYDGMITTLQNFQDDLNVKDNELIKGLTEKRQIYDDLFKFVTEQETPHTGLLLQEDVPFLQQRKTLLDGAIFDGENLMTLLSMRISKQNRAMDAINMEHRLMKVAETCGKMDAWLHHQTRMTISIIDGEASVDYPDGAESSDMYSSDEEGKYCHYSKGLEQSADEVDGLPPIQVSPSIKFSEPEVWKCVISLTQKLNSLKVVIAKQDSQDKLQQAFQPKSQEPVRNFTKELHDYEKKRKFKKQQEEMNKFLKMQAQLREEQQSMEKEKERQKVWLELKEEECQKWEEKLKAEKADLERQNKEYQQNLERLRKTTVLMDKEKESLKQEKERLEKYKKKYFSQLGQPNYDDLTRSLTINQSVRGSANGVGTLPPSYIFPTTPPSDHKEIPPKVPPRRESIKPQSVRSELPPHLVSTTNQVHKPAAVQQQIPTKLAAMSKEIEKEKGPKKKSHQRAKSAANIDVSQLVPIKATGKEGGSLRAQNRNSPERLSSDTFNPPGGVHGLTSAQSFSTNKLKSSDTLPPAPPPFPKEILRKEKDEETFC
ncbi:rho guanine nucleotide exchange factor 18a isoform 2-T3 [Pholidichthys leucotaenia]